MRAQTLAHYLSIIGLVLMLAILTSLIAIPIVWRVAIIMAVAVIFTALMGAPPHR